VADSAWADCGLPRQSDQATGHAKIRKDRVDFRLSLHCQLLFNHSFWLTLSSESIMMPPAGSSTSCAKHIEQLVALPDELQESAIKWFEQFCDNSRELVAYLAEEHQVLACPLFCRLIGSQGPR
jgi:hypothetical protein